MLCEYQHCSLYLGVWVYGCMELGININATISQQVCVYKFLIFGPDIIVGSLRGGWSRKSIDLLRFETTSQYPRLGSYSVYINNIK